jgi:hypothetical protein
MAFDKKVAYWIGESKTISKPYFGDKMIGGAKKTLK